MKTALIAVVFFAVGCGKANMEVQCTMNGFGNGSCSFTNTGDGSGALCGNIDLSNESEKTISSAKFCSGQVEPSTTKQVEFGISGVQEHCADSAKKWNEVCGFVFNTDDLDYIRNRNTQSMKDLSGK